MEVYGKKPKKFTKAWWEYFWMYYKLHTLAVVFAVVVIGVTVWQIALKPNYDLQIDFVSEYGVPADCEATIGAIASDVITDATGNGKIETSVVTLDMSMGGESAVGFGQAVNAKFATEHAEPTAYVFILSEEYAKMSVDYGIYENTDVWAGEKANGEFVLSLKESDFMPQIGINPEVGELYVGVVALSEENKDNAVEQARYENGVKFARKLVGLE